MTISCHLCRYNLFFLAKILHGFLTRSSHGISMAFTKKMMGFPVRICPHFRPNCGQKDMTKSVSHFEKGNPKVSNFSNFYRNVSGISSCLFYNSLVEIHTKFLEPAKLSSKRHDKINYLPCSTSTPLK